MDPVAPSELLEVAPAPKGEAPLPDEVFDLQAASPDVLDDAISADAVAELDALGVLGREGDDVPVAEVGDEVRLRSVDVDGMIPGASVAFTLRHADAIADASWAELVVDPDAFAGAYGSDYADRLELWAFPSCALDTPENPECLNGTRLPDDVETDSGALVVEVPIDPMEGVSGPALAYGVGGTPHLGTSQDLLATLAPSRGFVQATSSGATVLAAVAGSSSDVGTFTATDLPAAGTWGTSEGTGAFTYSIPLELPPASIGSTPGLALNYSSAAVDGRSLASNGQAPAVGEGWDFSTGYIERLYKSCADDNYTARAGDLCWYSPESADAEGAAYVMNFGGASYPLVWDGDNRYRTADDTGWRITHHTGGKATNDDNNNEYFKLALPDGSRYFFGLGELDDGTVTNSVATVPVFGDDSGEPRCGGTAASNYCIQGYRWMMDEAIDRNENAVTYRYALETNKYAVGGDASTSVSYTSAVYLSEIRYGQRSFDLTNYEVKVLVDTRYRCVERSGTSFNNFDDNASCPSRTVANAGSFPDVPLDLKCTSTCASSQDSPTFFTAQRYDGVLVKVKKTGGGWMSAYRHQFGFAFPATDDGSARSLWLDTVQTRYYTDGDTTDYSHGYAYDFDGAQLKNRVDTTSTSRALDKRRITKIYTPLGARIDVDYANAYDPQDSRHCPMGGSSSSSFIAWYPDVDGAWDQNTWDCYPVYFDPDGDGGSPPGFGVFHRYVVESVEQVDLVGGAPTQTVNYRYIGNPAWAYQDSPLTARGSGTQTWNDYRGYTRVIATRGSGADEVETATQYFRGMNGDWNVGGTTKDVKIGNLVTGNDVTDAPAKRGRVLSVQVRRADGKIMSTSTTAYSTDTTADGPGVHDAVAVMVDRVDTAERVLDANLDVTSDWRSTRVSTTYDGAYRPIEVKTDWGVVGSGDVVCTETSYATTVGNDDSFTSLSNDGAWGQTYYQWFVEEVITHDGNCSDGVTTARTLNWFDGAETKIGQHPIDGNVTTQHTFTDDTHKSSTTTTYDAPGRVRTQVSASQYDATNPAKTKYDYSDLGESPRTVTTTSTSPTSPTFTAESTYEVVFGQPIRVENEQGQATFYRYNERGQLADGWAPRQSLNADDLDTSRARTVHYNYSPAASVGASNVEPAWVEEVVAPDNNTMSPQQRTLTYFNGAGQPIEVHTPTKNGDTGRLVSVTRYDEIGRVAEQSEPYAGKIAYSRTGSPANPNSLADAPAPYSITTYDWAGRAIQVARKDGGTYLSGTTSVYRGDRTTTIALGRGRVVSSASTTRFDERGRTDLVRQHQGWDTTTGASTGSDIVTTYAYSVNNATGASKVTITDAAGAATVTTTDVAGRTITLKDPNAGTSTYTYDDDGNILEVTSPAGEISMSYDTWDRMLTRVAKTTGASTPDATTTWHYDTSTTGANPLAGMLFETTHTTTAGTVTSRVDTVDDFGAVTDTTQELPADTALGELAGVSYSTSTTYDQWGRVKTASLPAIGGLAAETVTTTYDAWSRPATLTSGATDFVTGKTYLPDGKTATRTYGNGASSLFTYDTAGRVDRIAALLSDDTTLQSNFYNYADTGTLESMWNGVARLRQCYEYDGYVRLTQSWTQKGDCDTTAATTEASWNVGATAYSNTWSYSATGRITAATTSTGDGTTATTDARTYTYASNAHPAAVTATTGTSSNTYTYDDAGRMITRTDPTGSGTDTLAWDPLSNLTSAGDETYLYDGTGQRIARIVGDAATVWIGSDEITDPDTTTTGTLTATRTYTSGGATVAVRHAGDVNHDNIDDTGIQLIFSDLQGSAEVSLDVTLEGGVIQEATTTTVANQQAYSPYGTTRGSSNLTQSRGWLGQIEDTTSPDGTTGTGLTYLNARYYDAELGRFISPDPILIPGDPRTLDPYMYAGNNPITYVDSTGLAMMCADAGTTCGAPTVQGSTPSNSASKSGATAVDVASYAWDAAVDYVSGSLSTTRETLTGVFYMSAVGPAVDPAGTARYYYGEWMSFTADRDEFGYAIAIDRRLNPVHQLLEAGDSYVNAVSRADSYEAGRSGQQTVLSFASLLAVVGPGAKGMSPRGVAANSGIGFAEGLGKTALTPGRLQHGTKNLTKAGVLPAWSGKNSPGVIERAFVPILERPAATFDHTLGGTRVRGFLGDIDGNQVALFVYKEGPFQGQLASSFVPSGNQLKMWGVP